MRWCFWRAWIFWRAWLEKWGENFEGFGDEAERLFEAGGFGGDFDARLFGSFKVGGHVGEAGGLVHPGSAFKMVDKGAEVEVDGAADAEIVVAEHAFSVDETGFVFIDFDAALEEGEVIGAGHEIDDFLVRDVRGNDLDIDAFFGGKGEGVHDFAVANEIRRGDAEGLGGAVNEV